MARVLHPMTGTIETPVGVLKFAITAVDQVTIETGIGLGPAIVNGVEYGIRARLRRFPLGRWVLFREEDFEMSRWTNRERSASPAVRKKYAELLVTIWNDFSGRIAALEREAEIDRLVFELGGVEDDLRVLSARLADRQEARNGIVARLRDLDYYGPQKQDWTSR